MRDKICDYHDERYCDHDDSNVGRGSCNPKTCSEYKVNGVFQNKATPTPRVGVRVHKPCISCGNDMEMSVEESRTTDYCSQCSDTPDGRSETVNYGDDGVGLTQEQVTELIIGKPETDDIIDFVEPKDYTETESKSVQKREAVQKPKCPTCGDGGGGVTDSGWEKCPDCQPVDYGMSENYFIGLICDLIWGGEHGWEKENGLKDLFASFVELKKEYKSSLKQSQQEIEELQEVISIQKEDLENTRIFSSEKDKQISIFAKLVIEYDKQIEELKEALDGAHLQITKLRENLTIDKKVK